MLAEVVKKGRTWVTFPKSAEKIIIQTAKPIFVELKIAFETKNPQLIADALEKLLKFSSTHLRKPAANGDITAQVLRERFNHPLPKRLAETAKGKRDKKRRRYSWRKSGLPKHRQPEISASSIRSSSRAVQGELHNFWSERSQLTSPAIR